MLQLDYSASILPITHIDGMLDKLEGIRDRNAIERMQITNNPSRICPWPLASISREFLDITLH